MTGESSHAAAAARWQRVKEVFEHALELRPAEITPYLDGVCDGDADLREEVLSLLAAHGDAGDFLEEAVVNLAAPVTSAGRRIGPYKLESLLGQGGMGEVYLSTREVDGYPMQVALKLIRHSALTPRALRRFRMERRILARLHHPGITSLIDGGITDDGLPYLVTEFVAGTPLDKFTNTLPLRKRLELFLDICDAVSFAHRQLVVHGDLKPGNILVNAEGGIKLLDFGISRLLQASDDTTEEHPGATTQPAMTPAWTSPEQLRGEPAAITSDVYSLGRLLYFILTNQQALPAERLSPMQLYERLRTNAVEKPSRRSGQKDLEGDLDNIVAKTLEFEPAERYRSAEALADDIRAHLGSRPIFAHPHTWRYRCRKFIARNKAGVSAGVFAVLALIIGLGVALWQARIAQRNYEQAQRRFQDVRRLASTILSETDDAIARLPGATAVRGTLVRNSLQYLDGLARDSADDPALQDELAGAYERVGDVLGRPGTLNLGEMGAALQSYRKAEGIRRALAALPAPPADIDRREEALANTLMRISSILRATGELQAALDADRSALEMRRKLLERAPSNPVRLRNVASSVNSASTSLSLLGGFRGVIELRQEGLALYEQLVKANPSSVDDLQGLALAHVRMGSILSHENEHARAVKHYRESLRIHKQLRAGHPGQAQFEMQLALAHSHLGNALRVAGDQRGALPELLESESLYLPLVNADPNEVRLRTLLATTRFRLARVYTELGEVPRATRLLRATLEERRMLAERNPANAGARGEVAETLAALGDAALKQRQYGAARAEFENALHIFGELRKEGRSNAANEEEVRRIEARLAEAAKRRP